MRQYNDEPAMKLWRLSPSALSMLAPAACDCTTSSRNGFSVLTQFEKVENKPVVVGYIAGAVAALIVAEWLIHLPALDIVSPSFWRPTHPDCNIMTAGVRLTTAVLPRNPLPL